MSRFFDELTVIKFIEASPEPDHAKFMVSSVHTFAFLLPVGERIPFPVFAEMVLSYSSHIKAKIDASLFNCMEGWFVEAYWEGRCLQGRFRGNDKSFRIFKPFTNKEITNV